jgi:hypothetical protein
VPELLRQPLNLAVHRHEEPIDVLRFESPVIGDGKRLHEAGPAMSALSVQEQQTRPPEHCWRE